MIRWVSALPGNGSFRMRRAGTILHRYRYQGFISQIAPFSAVATVTHAI